MGPTDYERWFCYLAIILANLRIQPVFDWWMLTYV